MTPKLRSDLILLLAAIIWGFAFVAQRLGMEYIGPFTYTAVRFALGVAVLLPFYYYRQKKKSSFGKFSIDSLGLNIEVSQGLGNEKKSEKRKLFLLQILLGFILFGGISFQQYGLLYTTAGNAGFITGFYVVLVPVVGIFLGHKSHFTIWIGVVLAITGLFFLSVSSKFTINPGDLFVAICALFWTCHVLLVGYIAPKCDPIKIAIIQFALCSFLSWIVALCFETIHLQALLECAWPILYGGILSVGIAYTLQIVAQQDAHPAYASIILSMESLFAVLGGWVILHESFSFRSLVGCSLMLAGMIVVQMKGLLKP